jgi:hypothetical protein
LIATGPLSVVDPTVAVMRSAGRLIVDPRIHAGEIARFTSHVVCGPTASDCDIWTGAIGADGYGRFYLTRVARSILKIVWHLLADPNARFRDLGPEHYTNRVATRRRVNNYVAQLTGMGYRVTLEPAA